MESSTILLAFPGTKTDVALSRSLDHRGALVTGSQFPLKVPEVRRHTRCVHMSQSRLLDRCQPNTLEAGN